MKDFTLNENVIDDGFWARRREINAAHTIPAVYARFKETGRFEALKCNGSPAHIYWDSDIAKWLEAAAYLLARKENAQIRAWYDEAVEDICGNQQENGYFNSYFQVFEKDGVYQKIHNHELYCAGHLFEAAVAASKYLHDDRLLRFSEKYVDYIYERFVEKQDTAFKVPGHEEIELALLRLYEHTGVEKYKTLAAHFINLRGTLGEGFGVSYYIQNHAPVREQTFATGHAVRATYLYIAMADLARLTGDKELLAAVETIYEDIINGKMYITGGLGSENMGEKITVPYHLPNESAYAETCAGIGLALFCVRMQKLTGKATYGNTFERVLYNGLLSGVSLDGERFFYVNPLEMQIDYSDLNRQLQQAKARLPIPERIQVFNTSCCPPNICRFMEELPSFVWFKSEEKNELILSQYISSTLTSKLADAVLRADFPASGKISLKVHSHGKKITLKLRVPEWCEETFDNEKDGYLTFEGVFSGEEISLDFKMRLKKVYANTQVWANTNKTAFCYGPLVLCAESADNAAPLACVSVAERENAALSLTGDEYTLRVTLPAFVAKNAKALYSYAPPSYEKTELTLIPYYAWANRGKGDMRLWFPQIKA